MNKTLLIGIIVVIIALVVFEIVAVTRGIIRASESVLWFWMPLAVWIFLVRTVWKKKTNIFHFRMEPKQAERDLKRLKTCLLLCGISFTMFWLNILVGTIILDLPEDEFASWFAWFVAFCFAVLFVISAIYGIVIYLKGR